jgi:transposase-like protein
MRDGKRMLVFGNKEQIEELKRANENALFCPRCNSANTFQDGDVFEEWESFYCKDCGHDWGPDK